MKVYRHLKPFLSTFFAVWANTGKAHPEVSNPTQQAAVAKIFIFLQLTFVQKLSIRFCEPCDEVFLQAGFTGWASTFQRLYCRPSRICLVCETQPMIRIVGTRGPARYRIN